VETVIRTVAAPALVAVPALRTAERKKRYVP
jgi:hypothetical protein